MVEDVGSTNHRIIESFRLEKTLKIIEFNHKWDAAQTSQYHSTDLGCREAFPEL